jgi:DNA primase catalytic subunit
MIDLGTLLRYYKREDIRKEIVRNAKDREVAVKFGDKGFGKRPDILNYPADIIELAKQGATSFHASEELWSNPLRLDPNMKRRDIEDLRQGWDLVIDIDCPYWGLGQITAWLIIKALKENGITSISLKFSGNKGFHIGVPFEVFPETIDGCETRSLFPEAARKIALYLLDFIGRNYIIVEPKHFIFGNKFKVNIDKLSKQLGKNTEELTIWECKNCKKRVKETKQTHEEVIIGSGDIDFMEEQHYKGKVKKGSFTKRTCGCSNPDHIKIFNVATLIDIDTILISSRHLYRMPYSLHEKSGLASLVFNPEKILNFKREFAKPDNIKVSKHRFLDKENVKSGEGTKLLNAALAFAPEEEKEEINLNKEYEMPKSALPTDFFPPCIKKILNGIEDGRKRSLFTLVNFLTCVGWDHDKIDALLKEWNKKNYEPLREVLIVGQLRYHKQQKKRILPPNCSNKMYYQDIGCCIPDNLCKKIKNPVNYAKIKVKGLQRDKGTVQRPRLTEEQKEMRRKYREKLKKRGQIV